MILFNKTHATFYIQRAGSSVRKENLGTHTCLMRDNILLQMSHHANILTCGF